MKPACEFRRPLLIMLALLAIGFGGCASYRNNEHIPVLTWPLQNTAQKQSINLFVTARSWINQKEVPADTVQSFRIGTWRTQASKAYEESGLFSNVKYSSEESTDLRADVEIVHRQEFNETLAFITGLTFGLSSIVIPQKHSDTFMIATTFKDKEGRVLASFTRSETVNTWVQLFLVFAMPFRDSQSVTLEAAHYDLHRSVLEGVHQKHLLKATATSQAGLPLNR